MLQGRRGRRKEERQAEEQMGGQYEGVDWLGAEQHLEESRESWGMRELVAKTPVGAPMVHDYGIGEGEGKGAISSQ